MTKEELMWYVGKKVHIYFKDGKDISGTLGYVDVLSAFFIGNTLFNVSRVGRCMYYVIQ